MKHTFNFRNLFIPLLLVSKVYAQCPTPVNQQAHSQLQAPTGSCTLFREDFVPKPGDVDLTIALNFYVYLNNGAGNWSTTTEADIDALIIDLNNTFSNLIQPNYSVPGVQLIQNGKIKFAKKSFYKGNNNTPAFDCNAINIEYYDGTGSGHSDDMVHMPADTPNSPGYPANPAGDPRKPTYYLYRGTLIHEICHILGIDHTNTQTGYTGVIPNIGATCCNLILADDVHLETLTVDATYNEQNPAPGDEWGNKGQNCNWSGSPSYVPFSSNNIMGYNDPCRQYLSPYQLAVIHYNLRTDGLRLLTPAGYANAVSVNHAFDQNITTNQTWTTDRYMKGDIIVKNGHSLTIKCNVAMTRNSRIVVEPMAQLYIDGGRVSNISGEVWKGIEVGGNSTIGQALNAGISDHQGMLFVKNNGTISNAEIAAKNYNTDVNGNINWNTTGGIIIGDNGNFTNNMRDVEFITYTAASSISKFTDCRFKTTGPIGKYSNGAMVNPDRHVNMWGIEGIKFKKCNFEYAAGTLYTYHGQGISSLDAGYAFDNAGTTAVGFQSLHIGVYAQDASSLRLPAIKNCRFYDNVSDGAYFQNINNLVFENNELRMQGYSDGLYLSGCQGYIVKNSKFYQTTGTAKIAYGIRAYNSTGAAHQIFKNIFNNLKVGIAPAAKNSGPGNVIGLKMNCNTFQAVPNTYDIAMLSWFGVAPTVMANQGDAQAGPYQFVRNTYGASSACSTCENRWYISNTSPMTINHPTFTDASTKPSPQPANGDIALNVTSYGYAMNSVYCSGQQSSGGDGAGGPAQRISDINSYIRQLKLNNTGDKNHFEIEASVVNKLNLFLTDTVIHNQDSVISILETNQGNFANADILTVYACIDKGDLVKAQTKINSLAPSRAEWATMLNKLLVYKADPSTLYNLQSNATDVTFWQNYATSETHDGYATARSILKTFASGAYEDPRPEPGINGNREAVFEDEQTSINAEEAKVQVYPNPASDMFVVSYTDAEATGTTLHLELKDAFGRKVYENTISNGEKFEVSLQGLANGIYMLSASDKKHTVYQTKIVCIK